MSSVSHSRFPVSFEVAMEFKGNALKPDKDWVVQKYGGTSIGKFPGEVVNIICDDLKRNRLAVVCSARSSGIKAEGTTTKYVHPQILLRKKNLKISPDCSKPPQKPRKATLSLTSPSWPIFVTITSKPPTQHFNPPTCSQISPWRSSAKPRIF